MTYLNTYTVTKILLSVGTCWFNLQAYYPQHIKSWSVRTKILPSYTGTVSRNDLRQHPFQFQGNVASQPFYRLRKDNV